MNPSVATPQHDQDVVLCRHQLFDAFSHLAGEFQNAHSRVKLREHQVLEELRQLNRQLDATASEDHHRLSGEQPVTQAFRQWLDELTRVRQQWAQRVVTYERGTEFRAKVGDSFLVYVYGKVNAGKSSLGNYIATGHHKPGHEHVTQYHQKNLIFGWQAAASGEPKQVQEGSLKAGFGVDRQECTRDIQYFTLPGLTWVDSPGLHSKTPENGELARRYAESADLVVYVMSAANPARESDLQEIRTLLALKKPMVFVITRADAFEEDEIDGEIVQQRVMMSPEERQAQISYVRQALHDQLEDPDDRRALANAEITTLSVTYAEEAETLQALQESGVPAFMTQMQSLVATKSVTMKLETPERNLKAFCKDLCASIKRLSQSQMELQGSLKELNESVDDIRQRMISALQNELRDIVNNVEPEVYQQPRQLAQQIREALQPRINVRIEQALQEQLEQLDHEITTALDFSDASDLPGFEPHYKEYKYSNEAKTRIGSGAGGGILGGVIGFFVGGPLGSAIGATIGSAVGERAGAALSGIKTAYIPNGDNREEIEQAAIDFFSRDIEKAIDTHYVHPIRNSTVVVQQTLTTSLKALENFRKICDDKSL